jgi:hypothetical protein
VPLKVQPEEPSCVSSRWFGGYGAMSSSCCMIRDLLNQGNGFRERMSATPLPEFEDPPVSEVSLSVVFAALVNWRSAHAGLYWNRINSQYPHTETHPPLPTQIEQFDPDIIHRPLRSHGPPYTKAEEAEFYRRNANGPVTVARGADDRKGRKSQAPRGGRAIF